MSKDAIGSFFGWLSEQIDVYAYTFDGDWLDIGHVDTLEKARTMIKEGKFLT